MNIMLACENFLIYKSASNTRLSTLKNYSTTIIQFITDSHLVNTSELTPQIMLQHFSELRNKGTANSTIRTKRSIIIAWINWLNDELITDIRNVSKIIPNIRLDEKRPGYMDDETMRRFLDAVELSKRHRGIIRMRNVAMVYLLRDTGMREGELARLLLTDVDLKNRLATISSDGKSRKVRIVPFTDETANKIKSYLRARSGNPTRYIWITSRNKYPAHTYIYKMIIRYARLANLPNIHPHMFRHTFATNMLKAGMSLNSVKVLLGHSSIITTMVYSHAEEGIAIQEYRSKVG